jgi:hypothetical protein
LSIDADLPRHVERIRESCDEVDPPLFAAEREQHRAACLLLERVGART